ncbi:MAG TPA: glycosyltransferase [Acidobacteriaceae bacterium]|jgi:glycosyltransferase involved in cell wall biosynthesis
MKVSILLNNYNYAPYLGAAIESALCQTYRDFELLIVDDGSTDGSRAIIDSYTDPRIVKIYQENAGQGAAFKTGFQHATGDYIAFLDSDDLWDPMKLETCIGVLEAHPDITLLNHRYRYIDAQGGEMKEPSEFQYTERYDLIADLTRLSTSLSLSPTSFIMAKRSECLKLGYESSEWRIGADTPVGIELGMRGRIWNLNLVLGSYRVHGNNLWYRTLSNEVLYAYFERLYGLANNELKRMGRPGNLDFRRSQFARGHRASQSQKFSFERLSWKLFNWGRKKKANHG